MTTHSSIFAWRIPGMGEPGGLPSRGRTESDTTDVTQQQHLGIFFYKLCLYHLLISLIGLFVFLSSNFKCSLYALCRHCKHLYTLSLPMVFSPHPLFPSALKHRLSIILIKLNLSVIFMFILFVSLKKIPSLPQDHKDFLLNVFIKNQYSHILCLYCSQVDFYIW